MFLCRKFLGNGNSLSIPGGGKVNLIHLKKALSLNLILIKGKHFDNAFNVINEIDKEDSNLKLLAKKANILKQKLKEKYKDNLDTEK